MRQLSAAAALSVALAACGPAPSKDAVNHADGTTSADTATSTTPTPPDGTPVGGQSGAVPDAATTGSGRPAGTQGQGVTEAEKPDTSSAGEAQPPPQ